MTPPPKRASSATVPPIAIAAAAPTARVSVATAMITNIRNAVSTISYKSAEPGADARHGRAEARPACRARREPEQQRAGDGAGSCAGMYASGLAGREVPGER